MATFHPWDCVGKGIQDRDRTVTLNQKGRFAERGMHSRSLRLIIVITIIKGVPTGELQA